MEEKFNIKKVKVHRTTEGTIFEITAAVIMFCALVVKIVAGHATERDWIGFGAFTVAVVISLLCAYSPSHINIFDIRLHNIRQVELSIRMTRIIAIALALMALMIAIAGPDSPSTKVYAIGLVIAIGIIGFIFIYLIQKAR